MGRWEPDARGRLVGAALELYAEAGYEQTTVADIAARAGVTERTFFRHFTDKREVLFNGSQALNDLVVTAVGAASSSMPPVDVVAAAFESASPMLDDRGRAYARQRSVTIADNPSLQERELLKMASLGAACAAALRARGVKDPAATLAAEAGVTVFRVGFERWIAARSGSLGSHIHATLDDLKVLTTG